MLWKEWFIWRITISFPERKMWNLWWFYKMLFCWDFCIVGICWISWDYWQIYSSTHPPNGFCCAISIHCHLTTLSVPFRKYRELWCQRTWCWGTHSAYYSGKKSFFQSEWVCVVLRCQMSDHNRKFKALRPGEIIVKIIFSETSPWHLLWVMW